MKTEAAPSSRSDLNVSVFRQLEDRVVAALKQAFGEAAAGADPLLAPTGNPKFGDYQSNAVLPLAKHLGKKPRELASQLLEHLDVEDMCLKPEIAGPGFVNFTLKPLYIESVLLRMQKDERLGIPPAPRSQRIVVDFSSPNIAKEMHVGHLRSTIIGDSICRLLEFRGHDVLRINHVGDWGTQFGMLITFLREKHPEALTQADALDIGDLVAFYKQAKVRFDEDDVFKEKSRKEVVRLQSGAEDARKAWELLCDQSRREFQKIYDRLDVTLKERGESFYNALLPDVVKDLSDMGLLVENDGCQCVMLEGYKTRDGGPQPLIIRKSDGGFNYATTDLAALRYRMGTDGGERLLYVVDAGQGTHFDQVFQVAKRAGWLPEDIQVQHVQFGLVQGEDGKKLKTRAGDTVRLRDLLDEAVVRAEADIRARLESEGRSEDEEFVRNVAEVVGISAVKYADLNQNRTSNYVFSYNKMLALQGNTAPYMLYAYVRVQGISRKGGVDLNKLCSEDGVPIVLSEDVEFALAKHLLQLGEVIEAVEKDLFPNRLCAYLFELSSKFNQFYDRCTVLGAEDPIRTSRLALCHLTARTLAVGLRLLGIPVLERM